MDRTENIQKEINKIYLEILELMKDLGEMNHKFSFPVFFEYIMDENLKECRDVNIIGIELFPQFAENPGDCILLVTNNWKKPIKKLPIRSIFILESIIRNLRLDLEEKDIPPISNEIIFFTPTDIIITDPCYIIKYEEDDTFDPSTLLIREQSSPLDGVDIDNITPELIYLNWKQELEEDERIKEEMKKFSSTKPDALQKTNEYTDLTPLGISDAIVKNNEYGDWECTVYNKDNNTIIGNFTADAGMVGVFSLSQVLKYNPDFDYHITKPHTTTLIKEFKGLVKFDKDKDGNVIVVGEGNINFFSKQTGL